MRKVILLLALSSTFVMCKKGEVSSESITESLKSADSTVSAVSEKADQIQEQTEKVLDSAQVKIDDYDKTARDLKEKFEKTTTSIDSLGKKISNVKLDSKPIIKKDSSEKKEEKIVVNVPAPKIIKETKIVYTSQNQPEEFRGNILKKTANIEIAVENNLTAKNYIENELKKYDGAIKSESTNSTAEDTKTAYLRMQIPLDKFDYFVEDLNYSIGNVKEKTINREGKQYHSDTLCDINIILYESKISTAATTAKTENFGDKLFSGIGSGWDVITRIFLFFVPFWPLFLAFLVGYYFYRKNRSDGSKEKAEL